jgi:hypothetical protein
VVFGKLAGATDEALEEEPGDMMRLSSTSRRMATWTALLVMAIAGLGTVGGRAASAASIPEAVSAKTCGTFAVYSPVRVKSVMIGKTKCEPLKKGEVNERRKETCVEVFLGGKWVVGAYRSKPLGTACNNARTGGFVEAQAKVSKRYSRYRTLIEYYANGTLYSFHSPVTVYKA